MAITVETLGEFESEIRKRIPEFSVRFKNESLYHQVIGFLTKPFNDKYLTSYTTTSYPCVYFPSKAYYERNPKASFTTLAHELVHLVDSEQHTFWWSLLYMLPQGLGLLPLVLFGVLAWPYSWILAIAIGSYLLGCFAAKLHKIVFWIVTVLGLVAACGLAVWLTGWVSAALFAGMVLLAPWPSPWRVRAEMRGYAMNVALMQWTQGVVPEILKVSLLSKFTTSAYYFMSWNAGGIYKDLNVAATKAAKGSLPTESPYDIVYRFLAARNLLKS